MTNKDLHNENKITVEQTQVREFIGYDDKGYPLYKLVVPPIFNRIIKEEK